MSGRRLAATQILVVRCVLKNGTLLHYTFFSPARSKEAFDLLTTAKRNRELAQFYDDAGRAASIDGTEIVAVNDVDIVQEAQVDLKVKELLQELGILPPDAPLAAAPGPERFPSGPEPMMGQIGGGGRFAE